MKRTMQGASVIRYLILTVGAFIVVIPMIYMITSSLRPNKMTFTYPPQIFPDISQLSSANYQYVLFSQNFFRYLFNTLLWRFIAPGRSPRCWGIVYRDSGSGRNCLWAHDYADTRLCHVCPHLSWLSLSVDRQHLGCDSFYTAGHSFFNFFDYGYIDNIPVELDEVPYWRRNHVHYNQRIMLPMCSFYRAVIFSISFPLKN